MNMNRRKSIGRLKLKKDENGMFSGFSIKPKRRYRKLLRSILDGDVRISAGFKPVKHRNPFKKYTEISVEKK